MRSKILQAIVPILKIVDPTLSPEIKTTKDRVESFKKTLNNLPFDEGKAFILNFIDLMVSLEKELGTKKIAFSKVDDFNKYVKDFNLDENINSLCKEIQEIVDNEKVVKEKNFNWEGYYYYFVKRIKDFENKILAIYSMQYFKKHHKKFLKELKGLIDYVIEFFEDSIKINSFGINFSNLRASATYNYEKKTVYFHPRFFSNYLNLTSKDIDEFSLHHNRLLCLLTIAHELGHEFSRIFKKTQKEITLLLRDVIGHQRDNFGYFSIGDTAVLWGTNADRIIISIENYCKKIREMNIYLLLEATKEYSKYKKLSDLKGLEKVSKSKLGKENDELIIKLPYKIATFIYNIRVLRGMIFESPAILTEFLFMIKYYKRISKNNEEVIKNINKFLNTEIVFLTSGKKIKKRKLSRLYSKYVKKQYRGDYRMYGQSIYPKLIKLLKEYDLLNESFKSIISKLDYPKEFEKFRQEWHELNQSFNKVLSKYLQKREKILEFK